MVECSNMCKGYVHEEICKYCKENYLVSSSIYKAKRELTGSVVIGYLVKDKTSGTVKGILNKDSFFQELAWIDDSTLEVYLE